jgi:hypothetical protein
MKFDARCLSRAIVALALFSTSLAVGADLDVVSTMNFESGGRKYVEPCVHNNTAEARQAHFKIGSAGVRWTFRPLTIPPGQTACFALDAPPIAPGVANEVHVE